MNSFKSSKIGFELLLAIAMAARAASLIFNEVLLTVFDGPFNLLAFWLMPTFILMALVLNRRLQNINKEIFIKGLILGVMYFMALVAEMYALKKTGLETNLRTTSVSLFESAAIILVPICVSVFSHRSLNKITIISTLVCLAGAGAIAYGKGSIDGDLLFPIASVIMWTLCLVMTSLLVTDPRDGLGVGFVQIGTMGVLSTIIMIITEKPLVPKTGMQMMILVGIILVSGCLGFALMSFTIPHISSERVGLFCGAIPIAYVVTDVIAYRRPVSFWGVVGTLLIILAMYLQHIVGFIKKGGRHA